jgi:hypothetical protein
MSNGGKTFTITLGPFVGTGSLQTVAQPTPPALAPLVKWTPSTAAKDLNGVAVSANPVTANFVAF